MKKIIIIVLALLISSSAYAVEITLDGVSLDGGGSTTITDQNGTAWRVFYSSGLGDVTELAFGASGTYLMSNGASVAPSFGTPAGGGDLLAANNLSDVASLATSYDTIKQAASETATGAVERATDAEVVTGADTTRYVSPASLAAAYEPIAGNPASDGMVWSSTALGARSWVFPTITDNNGTAWRVIYLNGTGDATELALGASGTYLKSNGAALAPSFDTPAGTGDVTAAANLTDLYFTIGDGGAKGVKTSQMSEDVSGNVTVAADLSAASVTVDASATPELSLNDSDLLGADEYAGGVGANATTLTDGAEVTNLDLYYMDAGTKTSAATITGSTNTVDFNIATTFQAGDIITADIADNAITDAKVALTNTYQVSFDSTALGSSATAPNMTTIFEVPSAVDWTTGELVCDGTTITGLAITLAHSATADGSWTAYDTAISTEGAITVSGYAAVTAGTNLSAWVNTASTGDATWCKIIFTLTNN